MNKRDYSESGPAKPPSVMRLKQGSKHGWEFRGGSRRGMGLESKAVKDGHVRAIGGGGTRCKPRVGDGRVGLRKSNIQNSLYTIRITMLI